MLYKHFIHVISQLQDYCYIASHMFWTCKNTRKYCPKVGHFDIYMLLMPSSYTWFNCLRFGNQTFIGTGPRNIEIVVKFVPVMSVLDNCLGHVNRYVLCTCLVLFSYIFHTFWDFCDQKSLFTKTGFSIPHLDCGNAMALSCVFFNVCIWLNSSMALSFYKELYLHVFSIEDIQFKWMNR
jgi:hypothetical protein